MNGWGRFFQLALLAFALAGCGASDLGVDQRGQAVSAESLRGQWLVINYWAEWCGPCRREIPELNALARQLDGQGVRILGVNFDALQGAPLGKATEQMGIEFTVLAQNPAQHFGLPPSRVLPATFIVDGQGRLREQLHGEQTAAGLVARLQALRGQP